jgi:hypothetical protein
MFDLMVDFNCIHPPRTSGNLNGFYYESERSLRQKTSPDGSRINLQQLIRQTAKFRLENCQKILIDLLERNIKIKKPNRKKTFSFSQTIFGI